jgi:hypothetical protein
MVDGYNNEENQVKLGPAKALFNVVNEVNEVYYVCSWS